MQHARCNSDGLVWEAHQFSILPTNELEFKRLNLICEECGEFAWFRKESRHGHPAHFCARHLNTCSLKVNYIISESSRDESTIEEDGVSAGNTIIVRLDQEQGGVVAINEVMPPPTEGQGEGGRTYTVHRRDRESSQHFTLRRILHRLVQSPSFRDSIDRIVFYNNSNEIMLQGPISDVVCNFENIKKEKHDGELKFYWGPVASAGYTSDGKIWLNSGERYSAVSVTLFPDIAPDFLKLFDIDDLEELAGAYVLVAGKCHFTLSGDGKPVIWCGTPNYIFVRKYRAYNT